MNACMKRVLSVFLAAAFLIMLPRAALAAESGYCRIFLKPQGGSAGTSEISVAKGGIMPVIAPPLRRGYSFTGYYTDTNSGGTQYYNAAGKPVRNCDFVDTAALYAGWEVQTYQILYENMENAAYGDNCPVTHTYGRNSAISNPTKESYTFFGWQVNGSPVAVKGLTLGALAYAGPITLTAVWNRAALVAVVDNATETVAMSSDDLKQVFQTQVTEPGCGVTAEDLNSEEVVLTMTATNADELAEGAAEILLFSQGEALKFYDFSVNKSVIRAVGDAPAVTGLYELPSTVRVDISLSEDMKGRTAYRVYRYHNGQAQVIPHGPVDDASKRLESFELSEDGSTLTLYTRRLSTYAVVGSEEVFSGIGGIDRNTTGMDVQGQILVSTAGPVYKVDIEWGPMRFQYSTGREWDPDEHRYTDVRINDWVAEHSYTGGNNQIVVRNHSNANVLVSFMVLSHLMDGVDMVVNTTNSPNGEPAIDCPLPKVPFERADAPELSGYLRLNGTPSDPEFYKQLVTNPDSDGYIQVGNIAVTITYAGGALTPKGADSPAP